MSAEVQPPGADATAPTYRYRIHLIFEAPAFYYAQSYRWEGRAATFDEAWGAAVRGLNKAAELNNWGTPRVLSYGSAERVPGTQSGPGSHNPGPQGRHDVSPGDESQ